MTIALGCYLPISTTSIIFIGALVRLIVEQVSKNNKPLSEKRVQGGVSLSSGLIAGSSIIGLIGIFLHIFNVIKTRTLTGFASSNEMAWNLLAVLIIAVIIPILRVKEDPSDEASEEK